MMNTTGVENTVVGSHALEISTGGSGLCVIGSYAARRLMSASGAIFVGDRVAPLVQSGYDSIFIGLLAGSNIVQSRGSVIVGARAGSISRSNLVEDVVCIGALSSVQGTGSVVVGVSSQSDGDASISVGYNNLSHGSRGVSIGTSVKSVGDEAVCMGHSNINIGSQGVVIGTLARNVGDASVCVGHSNTNIASRGIVIGAHSFNSSTDSIIIGNNIVTDVVGSGNLTILAGSGHGILNIQNTLVGGLDKTGKHQVSLENKVGKITLNALLGTSVNNRLSCDILASPKITVLSSGSDTSSHWDMSLLSSYDGFQSDLALTSSNGTQVTFCDDFVPSVLNFTAQHRCVLQTSGYDGILLPGTLLIATGSYRGLDGLTHPSIDESIPIVTFSSDVRDPRVFGVLSSYESKPINDRRVFRMGSLGFSIPTSDPRHMCRVIVNSGGEGGVRACDANGKIKNGDLLVSSPIPGVAMRQGDDIVRSCTIAKATCDCDFTERREDLIGCTYMC